VIKQINLNGMEITYELRRKPVKNLNLRIRADQSICVSANSYVPLTTIEAFLRSRSGYILAALDKFAERERNAPPPMQYADGEAFQMLGREFRLCVAKGSRNRAESRGDYVLLTVQSTDDFALKEKTMNKWMKTQCRNVVHSICRSVYPEFEKQGVAFPQIQLRMMVSRWGSCQPEKHILTFNTFLIKVPQPCIEYVVVHEFTHFLVPNHSKQFYDEMAKVMPDWKERKKMLEKGNYISRTYGQ